MERVILIVLLLFVNTIGVAQHLTFSRLLSLQKQDFNAANSFFIDANWETAGTYAKKGESGYAATWRKRSSTGMGICRIAFNPMEEAKRANTSLNFLTYLSDNKSDYDKIRRDIEAAGYKPGKPVLENTTALSMYTDGNIVVLIGLSNTLYIVKVMSYFNYAMDYTNELD